MVSNPKSLCIIAYTLKAQKMKTLKIQVKTKSNFHNLNGQWLTVTEISGTRVSVTATIHGRIQTVDFTVSEVTEWAY